MASRRKWLMALSGGAVHGIHALVTYIAPAVLIVPVREELDLTVSQATMPLNIGKAVMVLTLPIFGAGVDKYGGRVAMIAGVVLSVVAALLYPLVQRLRDVVFLQILFAFSYSLAGTSTVMVLVTSWFSENVGTSVGIVLGGYSMANTLGPLAIGWLVAKYNWRMAFFLLTTSLAFVELPLTLLLRPKEQRHMHTEGWEPVGTSPRSVESGYSREQPGDDADADGESRGEEDDEPVVVVKVHGFRRNLILLSAIFFLVDFIVSVPYEHLLVFLTQRSDPAQQMEYSQALWYFSAMNLSALCTKCISGIVSDRTDTYRFLLGSSFFFLASTLLVYSPASAQQLASSARRSLFGIAPSADPVQLAVFVILFGTGFGAVMNSEYALVPKALGRKGIGVSQSVLVAMKILGSASGSTVSSLLRDLTGTYLHVFAMVTLAAAITSVLASLLLLFRHAPGQDPPRSLARPTRELEDPLVRAGD